MKHPQNILLALAGILTALLAVGAIGHPDPATDPTTSARGLAASEQWEVVVHDRLSTTAIGDAEVFEDEEEEEKDEGGRCCDASTRVASPPCGPGWVAHAPRRAESPPLFRSPRGPPSAPRGAC